MIEYTQEWLDSLKKHNPSHLSDMNAKAQAWEVNHLCSIIEQLQKQLEAKE